MRRLCFAVCFVALICRAEADTVHLRSGEKIEGRITGETATEIQLEEKVSAGITDARTIQKADVLKVEKEAPDETAWQAMRGLALSANSLPAASYIAALMRLKGFADQFPQSAHLADAQKVAEAFLAEKMRVDAGEVKLENKWLSKDAVQKERYQIGALLAFNRMKELAAGDPIGALNSFDALEKNFPAARVFPDAVDLAKRVLVPLKAEVDRRMLALPAQKAEHDKAVQAAKGPQKAELMATDQRERAAAEALLANVAKQGVKWPPLANNSEPILRALTNKIAPEAARLANLPVAKMRESSAAAEQAKAAFESHDLAKAESSINAALAAWNVNELALRLQKDVAAEKLAAAAAPPAPTPATPAPVAATPIIPEAAPTPAVAPLETEADAPEEEARPFLLTAGGIITVLVVGAFLVAGVLVYRKIRATANAVIE